MSNPLGIDTEKVTAFVPIDPDGDRFAQTHWAFPDAITAIRSMVAARPGWELVGPVELIGWGTVEGLFGAKFHADAVRVAGGAA